MEYGSLPFSKTPLKFLFHRSTPAGGNTNTPGVAPAKLKKAFEDVNTRFLSTHAANFKLLIQHHEDPEKEVSLHSIDTGDGMNIFAGHYFDMNRDHLDGNLQPMMLGKDL